MPSPAVACVGKKTEGVHVLLVFNWTAEGGGPSNTLIPDTIMCRTLDFT